MHQSARWVSVLALVCFFVSGMAGLVYQTAWARYLGLFLGHTSYAVVAVLVAFMGGLALGNAWLGGRADRTRKPLALYAWLEIGIGIYALLFPFYYQVCYDLYVQCVRMVGTGTTAALALKFLFSFLTILVPTVMMGATFPALTRFVTQSLSELREKVAVLYFTNSAGAVAGCLVADFWWLPTIGLEATIFAAAALNLLVGLVALVTSLRIMEGTGRVTTPSPVSTLKAEESFTRAELRLAIVGIGLSGFVAMLYEVVWTRLLGLALGSSTHAFSLMLVTFISGITVGAWIVYRWKNPGRTLDAFGWAELALAATLLASMFFYEYLPFWFSRLASLLARRDEAYPLYAGFQALLCFGVMFIPTVCLGTTLPLVSRIATQELARTGRSVGVVFAVNTLGTVLGAAVTGLWLMPSLGLARTFALGVALNAAVAFLIVARRLWMPRPATVALVPIVVALWTWICGVQLDQNWRRLFTAGLWRTPNPPAQMANLLAQLRRSSEIVYYRDGAGATVSVHAYGEGSKTNLFLKINGKTDASSMDDMRTQVLSGHIPMLLNPTAREALVIGLGCGVTCAAVAIHPSIEKLDMVEISPEVVAGARLFANFNNRIHDNPKARMIIDDAKSHLLATDQMYDVIVSEPSNPWMAGVAGVFSREFYESCRNRLRTNGVMVQWVQAYESNDSAFEMVVATYSSVFPYVGIWHGLADDLLLIGSQIPFNVNLEKLAARFNHPAVRADLERVNVTSLPVLLSHELVSPLHGAFLPPLETAIHSDFYPALEYVAQRAFFVQRLADRWRSLDETYWLRPSTLLGRYLAANRLEPDDYRSFARFYFGSPVFPAKLARSLFLRWQHEEPQSPEVVAFLSRIGESPSSSELDSLRFAPRRDQLIELAEKDPRPLRQFGKALMQMYREHRTVYYRPEITNLPPILERLIETDPFHQRVYRLYLAELAWDRGDDASCLRLGTLAFDPDTQKSGPVDFTLDRQAPSAVLSRMTQTFIDAGRLPEAWKICQDAEQQGYLGVNAAHRDARLEMLNRKLQAIMSASGETKSN